MIDLKTIIDNLPIAIFVVDKDLSVLLYNRMAADIHGIDRRESTAKRLGDTVDCANVDENEKGCGFSPLCGFCQVKAMVEKTFSTQKSTAQLETNITTHSKGVRCQRLTATYIGEKKGVPSAEEACIVTVEDITDLKKKEHLAAASETIGAICHEMNQPLQVILGNVELLARGHLDDNAFSRVEKILSEMERIKNFTGKLLNLTDYRTKAYLSTKILDVEESTK